MLYHVTLTHTPDNCPLYNPELRNAMNEGIAAIEKLESGGNLKVHFLVTAAPAHQFFGLFETDDYAALQHFLASMPVKQEFLITPVVSLQQGAHMLEAVD